MRQVVSWMVTDPRLYVTCVQQSERFFLRPTAIPLEQKLTQNPPESPLRALLAHTKSPNSLIYARKKVRDLNGKGAALVRVLAGSL